MTVDERITIEPKDILAIQLECQDSECRTVTVWQVSQLRNIERLVCPGCEKVVVPPRSLVAEYLRNLTSGLVGLADDARLRFQITKPT